ISLPSHIHQFRTRTEPSPNQARLPLAESRVHRFTPEHPSSDPSPAQSPEPEDLIPAPQAGPGPQRFSALELQQIVAVTTANNPFLAEHGRKAKAWAKVAAELHSQHLCLNSTADSIKHKVKKLIEYHEVPNQNPNPRSGIARALAEHPSIEALMPAKLDQPTGLRDGATHVDEGKRAKARKEEDEKTAQGAYIRNLAMRSMGSRAGAEASSSETDAPSSNDEYKENQRLKKCKREEPALYVRRSKKQRLDKTPSGQLLQVIKDVRGEERRERQQRDDRLINIFEKTCEAQCIAQRELVEILTSSLKQNE
ncbi:hypothetical protein BD309DRAFT_1029872, partial [Dichomitus squalens]